MPGEEFGKIRDRDAGILKHFLGKFFHGDDFQPEFLGCSTKRLQPRLIELIPRRTVWRVDYEDSSLTV